jgi:hypothetical protein
MLQATRLFGKATRAPRVSRSPSVSEGEGLARQDSRVSPPIHYFFASTPFKKISASPSAISFIS